MHALQPNKSNKVTDVIGKRCIMKSCIKKSFLIDKNTLKIHGINWTFYNWLLCKDLKKAAKLFIIINITILPWIYFTGELAQIWVLILMDSFILNWQKYAHTNNCKSTHLKAPYFILKEKVTKIIPKASFHSLITQYD